MLIPREHGAYGQLGFPIAAALAAGRPTLAALALAAGFVAGFLAHESLLVLVGARGLRARRDRQSAAIRDGTWLSVIAVAGLAIGASLMPSADRWTVLVPAACAAGVLMLAAWRLEKTTAGEMFVALSCVSCALPIAAAAGLSHRAAVLISVVMTMGYWAATAVVRGTIARQRRESHQALRVAGAFLAVAAAPIAFILARAPGWQSGVWIATLPLSTLSLALAVAPPHARHLRRVGWAFIGASAVATLLLALLVRS